MCFFVKDGSAAQYQCATWDDLSETWLWLSVSHLGGTPGIRKYGASWVDLANNTIFLFGGTGGGCASSYGDMFRATVNMTTGVVSSFQSVSYASSSPGTRVYPTYWQHPTTGIFYLFGGSNCSSNSLRASNSDLWTFNPATLVWTQLKDNSMGINSALSTAVGVESASNWPSLRRAAQTVVSNDGNFLYMFGGSQFEDEFPLGDLWRYRFSNGQWALMAGQLDKTYPSRYSHDESAFDPSWLPAATRSGSMWMDGEGYIWLYGGVGSASWVVNDVWCFSPSLRQWGRVKGMPFLKQTSTLTAGNRYFSWPGSISSAIAIRKSSDPTVLYMINGLGYSTAQLASAAYVPDIWRMKVAVKLSQVSTVPPMPQAPIAGHTPGLLAKWVQSATCGESSYPSLAALTAAAATVSTSEVGYLLRYDWGSIQTPPSVPAGVNRSNCFGAQFSGYLWNPSSIPITFRFWVAADDGIQVEWSTEGQNVLLTSTTWASTTSAPYAPHGTLGFFSEALMLNPGATWFRLSYFDSGGGASLMAGLVAEDSVSNFRMLHSSFVTQNYIPPTPTPTVMPTAVWTPVDLRTANSDGSSPTPSTWPGSTEEGMKWEMGDFVILCGGSTCRT